VYDLYATAAANVALTGAPPGNNYAFALAIVPIGTLPAGVDISRLMRRLHWNGAAITAIDRLDVEPPVDHAGAHALGGTDPLTAAAIGAAVAGAIVNADVAAGAAIAMSKLQLAITNAEVAAGAGIARSKLGPLSIVNADVDPAAAVAQSKVALAITNAEVAAGAAIAKSKLAALVIVDADVAAGAAIAEAKLALASDAAAGTASRRTLGAGALQAAAGNDARIVNALDKTLLDAKGDLLVATAADTPARLAVGADGLFLKADAAAAGGVSWATPHVADLYANRPAAAAALNGLRFFATDKMMEWQCIAAAWVLVAVFAPEVAGLPAGPIDQQECIYVADATKGIKWHLRYRAASASAYKWEPVNGATPLTSTVDTNEAVNSAVFANAATLGPDVTVPLAGDYEADFEAQSTNGAAAVANTFIGLNVGGVAPSGARSAVVTLNAVNHQAVPYKSVPLPALTAATLLRLQYGSGPAQAMQFLYRRLRVRPVRVG
jgi:hypothetical protein